jgi:hypothetical protein
LRTTSASFRPGVGTFRARKQAELVAELCAAYSVDIVRKVLRKAEYVIYDRFVDVFSEPRNEPPIQRAQINRLSNGGFFVPVFCCYPRDILAQVSRTAF